MNSILSFLLMLLIAGVCGFVASSLMGAKRMNLLLLILLGFAGAWLGKWIQHQFGLPPLLSFSAGGQIFPVVWTVLGSIVIVAIFSFFRQR
jgi:uncharacterized membrane protein YeaQ/YmgE (transglycosylase-associated protein family)